MSTPVERATRYNEGKPRLSLVPATAIIEMGRVMTFGAQKYEANNWKKGMPIDECLDSCLRHLTAFMNGEANDKESGLSHISHAMTNLAFITYYMEHK